MARFSLTSLRRSAVCLLLSAILTMSVLALGGPVQAAPSSPPVQVGSEVDFPPYAFVTASGQPAGFSVDLIQAVAGAMNVAIRINTGPWDTVWTDLLAGRLDVLPIVAKSPERQRLVDFSLPHTETYDAFFSRQGSPPLANLEAAAGREIVVMRSDAAHHELVQRQFQGQVILVETIPAGLSLIASGKHDAFLCSKLIGTMVIKEHGLNGLVAGSLIPDYKRIFAFAVKKGDTELLEKLNQGLLVVKTSGEYDRIYEKWLTADDPWRKFAKYLKPALAIVLLIILIAGFWVLVLQYLVTERTRELRLIQEQLEEKVAVRTAELSRANTALQESENRFRAFMDNSPAIAWAKDEAGRILYLSQTYENRFGVTLADWRGKTDLELWPPAIAEKSRRHDLAVLANGQPLEVIEQTSHAGGKQCSWWIFRFPFEDAAGHRYLGGIGVDITERQQAEEDLRLLNEKLEQRVEARTAQLVSAYGQLDAFFTHSITPMVFLDQNFNFIRVNEAYARACQRRVEDFPGHNHFEFYPNAANQAIFAEVLRTKKPYQAVARPFEFPDHPEWGVTYWDWTLMPILDENDQVDFLVFALNDVTERHRAEQALRESEERLRALAGQLLTAQEQERKRLAAELHDELGHALLTMKLSLGAIARKLPPDLENVQELLREQLAYISHVLEEVRRLYHDLSPGDLEYLGLKRAVENLVADFGSHQPDITLAVELPELQGSFSLTVQTIIYRLVQEALTNIGKYAEPSKVRIAARAENQHLRLVIEDDGRGFDPAAVERDPNRGVGLAAMRERLYLIGGSLDIWSQKNQGTRLTFTIPASPRNA